MASTQDESTRNLMIPAVSMLFYMMQAVISIITCAINSKDKINYEINAVITLFSSLSNASLFPKTRKKRVAAMMRLIGATRVRTHLLTSSLLGKATDVTPWMRLYEAGNDQDFTAVFGIDRKVFDLILSKFKPDELPKKPQYERRFKNIDLLAIALMYVFIILKFYQYLFHVSPNK